MTGQRPSDLVMLPGAGSFAAVWNPLIAHLPDDIATHPIEHLAIDDLADLAEALLPDLPKRFALLGHSFGCHVALALFAAAPERVERLAIVATGTGPETDERMDMLLDHLEADGYEAVIDGYRTSLLEAGHDEAMANEMSDGMIAYGADTFTANIRAARNRPDWSIPLAGIRVPSLFVAGSNDTNTPPAGVQALAGMAPGARYQEIPDCTHAIPVERPAELSRLLLDWWEEVD